MDTFTKAYQMLNTAQKEAVDSIEGPVMVIAGPGTGKTQILTLRIANILKQTDTPADGILALTFTESGVAAIRDRLAEFIGSRAYDVHIHTFHGFATYLADRFPDVLVRLHTGTLIDEIEQYAILRKGFDALRLDMLSTLAQPYRAMDRVLPFILQAKRELWTPEKLLAYYEAEEQRIRKAEDFKHTKGAHKGKVKAEHLTMLKKIAKSKQVVELYVFYEDYLREHNLFDFEDQLLEVVRAFEKDKEFTQMVQEQFLYVLADEHQDANATQNAVLTYIGDFHDTPNLFVVGDEKQAIYRFQGAELDTFLSLKEKYPMTKVITLEKNYRSTQEVLDAAHTLIAPAPIPDPTLRRKLTAHRGNGNTVLVSSYETIEQEVEGIISYIQQKHAQGVSYDDVTILVRKNKQALPITERLRRAGIPFYSTAQKSFLEHPFGVLLLHLFAFLWTGQEEDLAQLLFIPGLVHHRDRLQLIAQSRGNLLKTMGDVEALQAIGVEHSSEMVELHDTLNSLSQRVRTLPLIRSVPIIMHELGIISHALNTKEHVELYHILEQLLHDTESVGLMHETYTLGDYLHRIELVKEHNVKIEQTVATRTGIRIMTLHKAKGLEFPYVIIPFLTKNGFDRKRPEEFLFPGKETFDAHDARRLLYVGITRAEKEAMLSYATVNAQGRSENKSELLCTLESILKETVVPSKELPLTQSVHGESSFLDASFIRDRLRTKGISATAYGTYKDSPWNYFFRSIVRLPEGKSVPLLYGNAIHSALEYAGAEHFAGNSPDIAATVDVFSRVLKHSFLTPAELEKYLPRGEEVLRRYLENRLSTFAKEGFVEMALSYSLDVPDVGPISVRGKLDRVDKLSDTAVRVVDYKTGKTRTRKYITGEAKDGRVAYYTQIMFYALLLYRNAHKQLHMREGVIEFVEADDKGKFVSHTFDITEKEILSFEKGLIRDLQEIAKGKFLKEPCDPKKDGYCDLVSLLSQ